jgi:DNA-binding NtrC family response regulator
MAGLRRNRTSPAVPLVRETSTADAVDDSTYRGMTLADAISNLDSPPRTDDPGAAALPPARHGEAASSREGTLGAAMAAAGIGVTVHAVDGRLLTSNAVVTALGSSASASVDATDELFRPDGRVLRPEDLPAYHALAQHRPVRSSLISCQLRSTGRSVWLYVDAIPCVERPGSSQAGVVSLWTAAAGGPVGGPAFMQSRSTPNACVQESFPEIDGRSPEIETLKHHMACVARDPDVTVLILGESGTGKERVANAIHRASPRSRAPFVVVNCAGLSPSLVEDELFGHVRGAFTGAIDDQPGPFERANGGTVFLDEIGELTSELQIKLLRALQARTVQRLGGRRETPFDVRVIAATHVDLGRAKARGRFREDLYYRLKVYELRVPPLRRRHADDIEMLVTATLTRLADKKRRPVPVLDESVAHLFQRYPWPGNIRELENTLERMMVAAGESACLGREHLPDGFGAGESNRPRETPSRTTEADVSAAPPSASDLAASFARHGSNHQRTAAEFGLSRHQLYRLLKRYGIRPLRQRE